MGPRPVSAVFNDAIHGLNARWMRSQQHCATFIGRSCQRLQAAGICCAHGSEQDALSCLQKFAHLPEIQTAVIRKIYMTPASPEFLSPEFLSPKSLPPGAFLQIQVLTPGRCLQKERLFCVAANTAMDIMVISAMVIPPFPLSDSLFTFCWLYGITKIDGIIRISWGFFPKITVFSLYGPVIKREGRRKNRV